MTTGTHLRYTWHVAYSNGAKFGPLPAQTPTGYYNTYDPITAAAVLAREHGLPVTIARTVGAVAPWPDEPGLTITSYVRRPPDPHPDAHIRACLGGQLEHDAFVTTPGRFARALADAFDQSEVVWTEESVTLNTTTRTERTPS